MFINMYHTSHQANVCVLNLVVLIITKIHFHPNSNKAAQQNLYCRKFLYLQREWHSRHRHGNAA